MFFWKTVSITVSIVDSSITILSRGNIYDCRRICQGGGWTRLERAYTWQTEWRRHRRRRRRWRLGGRQRGWLGRPQLLRRPLEGRAEEAHSRRRSSTLPSSSAVQRGAAAAPPSSASSAATTRPIRHPAHAAHHHGSRGESLLTQHVNTHILIVCDDLSFSLKSQILLSLSLSPILNIPRLLSTLTLLPQHQRYPQLQLEVYTESLFCPLNCDKQSPINRALFSFLSLLFNYGMYLSFRVTPTRLFAFCFLYFWIHFHTWWTEYFTCLFDFYM